ncbi:MAG: cytochrome c-type biogenesis protein CcmH [Gammaproteobacteria bacterium]|nr:cytochrome c-type biogenesis protein CcmH [Gammaproteobacteria bacterium]MBI5615883.1 cytochrome c-type biogenesis protein CcmH [Gammaproteobacteria bacterium]
MSELRSPSRFCPTTGNLAAAKPGGRGATLGAWICVIALCSVVVAARAVEADPFEARMRMLGEELRCLVCQNQTLADSQSGLAEDMRREMRTMMSKGMTDREIVDFLVQRYGDFVRYRPPVKATTAVLWYGPALALLAGLFFLWRRIARRAAAVDAAAADLSAEERAQLQSLMTDGTAEAPR